MVVPNGVDQQGNRQGMVVSGTDNTHDNNQPAGPDGNGASEQPDTHTTQPDGEGNEGEGAPPVPATPTDTAVPPQVVASEQFHLGARRSFTPLLRLRDSGAFHQDYTEPGTQANLTVDNNVTHLLEGRLQGFYAQERAFTSGTGHLTLSMGALVRRASGNDRFSGSLFGPRFSHRLTAQKNSEYGGLRSLGFGIPVADRGRLFGRVEGVFLGRDDSDLSAVVGVQIDF